VTSPMALTLGAQAESEQAERDRLAAAHERACWRAEYAHLLHDADPDSKFPAFVVSLVKAPKAVTA
jgi:uncharacterized protein with beta-barrel porin domain